MDEELISPAVDASAYASGTLQLEYDQVFDADFNQGDTGRVYVFDGADWVMIYEAWSDDGSIYSGGVHKVWDVSSYANANFQVKFHYIEGSETARGRFFAIDNVRLRASMSALDWLTVNGTTSVSGVVLPDADMIPATIVVQMDATDLSLGTYNADIIISSTDPGFAATTIPVSLNVVEGYKVFGNINYANAGMTPLEACTIELYNDNAEMILSATTDALGYYEFTGVVNGDYTIETNCSLERGGTNILDPINTRQYLGGTYTMDELQQGSADVNSTMAVDILDAILMQQSLSGAQPGGWTAPDWIFLPAEITVLEADIEVSYEGLCSGDPNGSYTPAE
jgi:hypothetical protein